MRVQPLLIKCVCVCVCGGGGGGGVRASGDSAHRSHAIIYETFTIARGGQACSNTTLSAVKRGPC